MDEHGIPMVTAEPRRISLDVGTDRVGPSHTEPGRFAGSVCVFGFVG